MARVVKLSGWQVVAVLGILCATIAVLAVMHVDMAAFLGFGTLIVAGLGFTAAQSAKENTNGNVSRMLLMLESMANRMGDAPALPPAKDSVDAYRG